MREAELKHCRLHAKLLDGPLSELFDKQLAEAAGLRRP
jgi:hypothetical protein